MKNKYKGSGKTLLQETIAKSIGTTILNLQKHWAGGMHRLFNYLPPKVKIAALLLSGVLLGGWNIALLSNSVLEGRVIPPIQAKRERIPVTLASDSLILMEKIYESHKKPQR